MRLSILAMIAAISAALLPVPMRADVIDTFYLDATLQDGGTVVGTVSIDITNGLFAAEDVTYTSLDFETPFVFDQTDPLTTNYDGFSYATFTDGDASALLGDRYCNAGGL